LRRHPATLRVGLAAVVFLAATGGPNAAASPTQAPVHPAQAPAPPASKTTAPNKLRVPANLFKLGDSEIIFVGGKQTTAGEVRRDLKAQILRAAGAPKLVKVASRKSVGQSKLPISAGAAALLAHNTANLRAPAVIDCSQQAPAILGIQGSVASSQQFTLIGTCFGDQPGDVKLIGQFPNGNSFVLAPAGVLLLLGIAGACTSETNNAATGDAGAANGGDPTKCCPLSPPPTTCNGPVQFGGSRAKHPKCDDGAVDNVPAVARFIDEDGCPAYVYVYVYVYADAGHAAEPVAYTNDCPKREASTDAPVDATTD
jgi:hypothetical protein